MLRFNSARPTHSFPSYYSVYLIFTLHFLQPYHNIHLPKRTPSCETVYPLITELLGFVSCLVTIIVHFKRRVRSTHRRSYKNTKTIIRMIQKKKKEWKNGGTSLRCLDYFLEALKLKEKFIIIIIFSSSGQKCLSTRLHAYTQTFNRPPSASILL